METFYLGSHQPSWLGKTDVPLFVSVRRLMKLNRLPRARGPWAIDSSGFSELSLYGKWTISVAQYVAEVRRAVDCIGNVRFAAQQDWMTEEHILKQTGLTVAEHQQRTIDNMKALLDKAPELPWVPVLQGWTLGEYWDHAEAFERAGMPLTSFPLVGLGSVCRRQSTTRIGALAATLRADGLRVHAFGVKTRGLALFADQVVSSDSLAWSYNARRKPALPECEGIHPSCQNCLRFALRWRKKLLTTLGLPDREREEPPVQGMLFDE